MTVYIEDTQFVAFLEKAKDALIDNPGICPMNDLQLLVMEMLDVAPVSVAVHDAIAFTGSAERDASDKRLAAILATPQHITLKIAA